MLNCKEGDLAIIVKSYSGNEGKIVKCLRYFEKEWTLENGTKYLPSWEIDIKLGNKYGYFHNSIPDEQLRPIRDQDGEDEMLLIVGKPELEKCKL